MMVSYNKRFYGLKVRDHLFDFKTNRLDFLKLCSYSNLMNQPESGNFGFFCNTSHTIINDLNLSQEDIFRKYTTTVKNSINKANTLPIKTHFGFVLTAYYDFFKKFAEAKKIYVPPFWMMKELEPNLMITTASLDGKLLVAHCYIIDRQLGLARLFQSASQRLDDHADSKTIAIANKYLTYKDMLFFKESGFNTYDFGGYALDTDNKSLAGINAFKSSFGGTITTNYNYNSLPYHLLLKISSALDKRFD